MQLLLKHSKLLLVALLGVAVGVGVSYLLYRYLMGTSMQVSARYKLVLSLQSVQLLKSGDSTQVLALQERALVNAVQAGRIALAETNDEQLKQLLNEAEAHLKQHPNANTADWQKTSNPGAQ